MDLPRIFAKPNLPEATSPRIPMGAYGAEVFGIAANAAEAFVKVQDTADRMAAARASSEASAAFEGTIKVNNQQITDPDEFAATTAQQIDQHHKTTMDSLKSSRAQQLYSNAIGNDLTKAKKAIEFDRYRKTGEMALGDFETTKKQLLDESVGAPADVQKKNYEKMGGMIGELQKKNFLTADKAAKESIDFHKQVESRTMGLLARQNPEDFINRVKNKEFEGKGIDDKAIQDALDVAGRVADLTAQRDKRDTKEQSEVAERGFEAQATERRMDINELMATARKYGWDKNKTDGLINMQIGIKAASPYAKQMIEEAMGPADANAVYSSSDVRKADENLNKLAKNGNISTLTPEWREAKRRLQSMTDRLRIQGDVKERSSEFDARQGIDDLYRQFMPGPRSDQVTAEIATHKRLIDKMDANQRRNYVDKTEKQLKDQFEKNKNPAVQIDKLRGAIKKK